VPAQSSAVAIANLLYGYAEAMDAGDFDAATAFFAHASIGVSSDDLEIDHRRLLALLRETVRIYPCGTPRTSHIVSNPIMAINEAAGTATCRSRYTVIQASDGKTIQVIAAGRYEDSFERSEGVWRFSRRSYAALDLVGDMSKHLATMPGQAPRPLKTGS
jgi:3-phenylpropionate/cinnamic acid dioxygenase small subunit